MSSKVVFDAISEHDAKFIDLRIADTLGKDHHITIPVSAIDEDFINHGKPIDGSSFKGWGKIHQSDLVLMPDTSSIVPDPFFQDSTLIMRCDVMDPDSMKNYQRCPRSLAKRAEAWLLSTGIADKAFFGPEPEFFIFDDVKFETTMSGAFYKVDSEEAHWNSGKHIEGGNTGHRPCVKGGYFPVPPVDSSHDIRAAISMTLERLGMHVEAHHHEVATANQCEVATRYNSLTHKADELQMLKYVVQNIAHNYGKTATFMPKPLVGDNGSGMHCHQSLMKDGVNIFAGEEYDGLSQTALYYIGGIIKHAKALNAFTNPGTNSYKRLIPGFEAPVLLAYSARNRSAAIRIPYTSSPKGRRIEVRFPDPLANPYLAFTAMLMAGVDGIENKIDPGAAIDKDLFELPEEELIDIPTVAQSLSEAIECLHTDMGFLLKGGVFSEDFIHSYIQLKKNEIKQLRSLTHPFEFDLYYSL